MNDSLGGDKRISNPIQFIDHEGIHQLLRSSPPSPSLEDEGDHLHVLTFRPYFDIPSTSTPTSTSTPSSPTSTSPRFPISFSYTKLNSSTSHTIYISSSSSQSPLVTLHPLDLQSSPQSLNYSKRILPLALNLQGQPYKNQKSSNAMKVRREMKQVWVPTVGAGGVLDCLVVMDSDRENTGIRLKGSIFEEIQDEEEKKGIKRIKLELKVYIQDTEKFFRLEFSRSKQILIQELFSHGRNSSGGEEEVKEEEEEGEEEVTIDFFYRSLRRARKTRDGLPLDKPSKSNSSHRTEGGIKGEEEQEGMEEDEEEEDQRLRRRRILKGKQKAIEPSLSSSNFEPFNHSHQEEEDESTLEEDELLKPIGLNVTLMPFQSRSVRWMLAREGKMCRYRFGREEEDEEDQEEVGDGEKEERKGKKGRGRKENGSKTKDEKKKDKGKGKEKEKEEQEKMNIDDHQGDENEEEEAVPIFAGGALEEEGDSNEEEEEEGINQQQNKKNRTRRMRRKIVVEDLPREFLQELKRGALWEKVAFRVISSSSREEESRMEENVERGKQKQEKEETEGKERIEMVWLNRLTGQISLQDPILSNSSLSVEDGGDDEEDERGEGEKDEAEEMDLDRQPSTSTSSTPKPTTTHDVSKKKKNTVSSEKKQEEEEIRGGGLLAEEVGTGKTITTISLILLHQNPLRNRLPSYYDPTLDTNVQPTGLNLIVCPAAIIGQWIAELEKCAPGLRCFRYDGIKSIKESITPSYLGKRYDIVLTTFDVVRKEINIAKKPVRRQLRFSGKKSEVRYRRSLLIEVGWFRVIADETQMVGDSFGPTSTTLSLVPRQHTWAVTSTPLRDKIEDIRPLLTFLKIEPFDSNNGGGFASSRLLEEPRVFRRLFNSIAERTLKSQIQNELFLPRQTRFIVPLEFTAIEKYYFDGKYGGMLNALGLNEDGSPKLRGDGQVWTFPDKGEMNSWLSTLRALAAHPQVGAAGRQALGTVLKTVEEVYAAMRDKATAEIRTDQRAILWYRVKRGQLGMWDKDVEDRFEPGLRLFERAINEVEVIIDEVAKEIHETWKLRKKAGSSTSGTPPVDSAVAEALQVGFTTDNNHDGEDRAFTQSISSLRNRLRDLLLVKHAALFFSGHAYFNMQKEVEEAEFYKKAEQLRQTLLQPYENSVEKAQIALRRALDARDEEHELEVTDLELPFNTKGHGLAALTVYEVIEVTSDILNGYAELIFQYREMIIQMLLKTVSIAGENATGEEYEERAVLQEKLEVYLEAYTVLLGEWCYGIVGTRSQLADQNKAHLVGLFYRDEMLIPEEEPLLPGPEPMDDDQDDILDQVVGPSGGENRRKRKAVQIESEEEEEDVDSDASGSRAGSNKSTKKPKKKKTRTQQKRAANLQKHSYTEFVAPTLENGHSPADVLRYELLVERIEAMGEDREHEEITPLRHLLKQLQEAIERTSKKPEIALLTAERSRIAKALGPLEKVADRLRAEELSFTTCFNVRIEYFKSLQSISDTVADPDMGSKKWRGLLTEIEALRQDENEVLADLDQRMRRKRYLDNLHKTDDDAERNCPICDEMITTGVLLNCVHLLCRACFNNWHARSHLCPICKADIGRSWQSVKYRTQAKGIADTKEEKAEQPTNSAKVIEPGQDLQGFETTTPKLAQLPQDEIEEILKIETAAPLSTKSDFIVKHVKFLRRRDPDAKIVIFSTATEALQLLMETFTRNSVQFVRLEGANGKGKKEAVIKRFAEDPTIAAFLLHSRSQSAGLTLTCAQYMMLVEPLLSSHLEIQSTARIWRIGQRKETTVFQYAILDSPDYRVAELRARRNTSLFLEDQVVDAEKESLLVQQTESSKKKVGGSGAEALDDEDDILRTLLSSEHYLTLQRYLLPPQLQLLPPLPAPLEEDHAADDVLRQPVASGSGLQRGG